MTNPIATALVAQANTAAGKPSGIDNGQNDLDSPNATFVDFLMTHLGSMNISEDDLTAITQDLADGTLSTDSPIFNILSKMDMQGNDALSAGNEMFLRELAGMFVNLNQDGDINLSSDILGQLEKISTGELPAEEFVTLIQDTDIFTKLRTAVSEGNASGIANIAVEPEDLLIENIDENSKNNNDDVANIEVVLKRLENLLENIQTRIANAASPRSKEALEKVAEHISGLITRFENKVETQNVFASIDSLDVTLNNTKNISQSDITTSEGFTPTRHSLLKAIKGQKIQTQQQQVTQAGQQQAGITVAPGITSATKKSTVNTFSLAPSGEAGWVTPVDGETTFDVKGMVVDQIQNSIKATKATAAQSTRTMLPPSPAAQQVMVHIQRNANNQSRMNIQLNPAELGRVDVSLTLAKDGRTTASVMADRPETLQLLQKDSAHLERALQNAGLDVNSQDLSFNLRGDGKNDFNSRRRFSRQNKNDDGLSIDAQLSGAQLDAAVFGQYRVNYKA